MKKELRKIIGDAVQITVIDERWYARSVVDEKTGMPSGYEFLPSVTWICGFYPKGIGYAKWLASLGWNEAEAVRQAAADKGSKVHQAVADLLDGQTVAMEAKYVNPSSGMPEELTLEEYECLMSFRDWWLSAGPPTLVAKEFTVWGDGYAGTADLLCDIEGRRWLIDLKSGQHVWPEHELQVSAYARALPLEWITPGLTRGILQVGYRLNKRRWKLTEVPDQYDLFLASKAIWQKECEGVEVFKRDYPLMVSLAQEKTP